MSELLPPDPDFFSNLNLVPLGPESYTSVLEHASALLSQRIRMLASGEDWPWTRCLTWNGETGQVLAKLLAKADSYDEPVSLLGYKFIDVESYEAIYRLTIHTSSPNSRSSCHLWPKLELMVNQTTHQLEWRLHDISIDMPAADRPLLESIEALKSTIAEHADQHAQKGTKNDSDQPDSNGDLDDYWGQYDASEDGQADLKNDILVEAGTDVDYYGRYEQELIPMIVSEAENEQSKAEVHEPISEEYTPILPDIVRHVESSLRSLRKLSHAANLTDRQFRLILDKIITEDEDKTAG